MNFCLEVYSINPHSKQQWGNSANVIFSFRWKEKLILQNASKEEVIERWGKWVDETRGKECGKYRIVNYDTQEIVYE